MDINAITSTHHKAPDTAQLQKAAQDFEALLIAGMLKSVREGESEGWMGTGSDQASASAIGMAEEQLAQSMAAQGGLGLAKMIVERMGSK